MFKNQISFTQSHQLSKKEKKEICSTLTLKYNKTCVDYIISSFNNMSIQKGNIQNHKRNVVFNENNPVLFEYDNKVYFPTVYLLQTFNFGLGRNIISNCCVIFDQTVSFIINGADLMLKGILNRVQIKNSEKNFQLGDLFYIQTVSGKIVGIGITVVSKQLMNVENPTGKFLKVLHKIGDSLWTLGNQKETIVAPLNIPETEMPKISLGNEDEKEEEEEEISTSKENKEEEKVDEEKNAKLSSEVNEGESTANPEEKKEEEKDTHEEEEEEDTKEGAKDIKEEEKDIQEEEIPTQEEIDENIDIVFLTLCKLHLQNEKFPMDPGKLYAQFMKPLAEEMKLNIDFKHSSYKKPNTYFKHLQKEKSLITFSKAKGQNNDYIQSINYNNEIIKGFKPRIRKIKFLNHQNEPQKEENVLLSKDEKIEVQILFKPNQKIKVLFPKYLPEFKDGDYYPIKTCNDVLKAYLKEHDLFDKENTGRVKLDENLEKVLSVHHTTFSIEERTYPIEEVLEMWKRNLNEKSCVMRTIGDESAEIFTKNLQIRIIAKKMNNKNVTLVSGLDTFIDLNVACKALAKYFATSVTIKDEIIGLKNAIFIQGYWVSELVEKLVGEFKINKKIIKIEDRLNKQKKKK